MTEEERRKVMRDLMREAGFVPGSGPPSPEVFQKVQELAKQRGLELDFGRWGGGNRGGNSGSSTAPTTRTVYKLLDAGAKNPQIKAVTVKLGISDGTTTEVVDGLAENDLLVTSITGPGLTAAPAGGANNPFAPRSPFGGPGGGRR
jgi:HlyD family secretion protein